MTLKIGVKFCGNCNPHIETGPIASELRQKAAVDMPEAEFTAWNSPGLDILLVLSGCPADCASRPEGTYRQVVVAGETVNYTADGTGTMADRVLKTLLLMYKEAENG